MRRPRSEQPKWTLFSLHQSQVPEDVVETAANTAGRAEDMVVRSWFVAGAGNGAHDGATADGQEPTRKVEPTAKKNQAAAAAAERLGLASQNAHLNSQVMLMSEALIIAVKRMVQGNTPAEAARPGPAAKSRGCMR